MQSPKHAGQSEAENGGPGSLTIAPRVVEKVAKAAALEVDGVEQRVGRLSNLTGQSLPKVEAQMAGLRSILDIEIALQWGKPINRVTAEVQSRVMARVQDLAGVAIDRANVTVGYVTTDLENGSKRVQ